MSDDLRCPNVHSSEIADDPGAWAGYYVRLEDAQARLRVAEQERDRLAAAQGALAAQEEREEAAGHRCGVRRELHGCDWPDAVAERLIVAEQERDRLRAALVAIATKNQPWSRDEMIDCAVNALSSPSGA